MNNRSQSDILEKHYERQVFPMEIECYPMHSLRKRKFDKEKEFKFHRLDYKSHVS